MSAPAQPTPAPSRADVPEFRFELDNPQVLADKAVNPVTSRLTVEGWVLARSGVVGVEVSLDDQRVGDAHYGLARPDVGTAFPDWNDALRSGYAFHCPPRALHDGKHIVQVTVRAKNGEVLEHRFQIDVKKSEEDDELATIRRRMTRVETTMLAGVLDSLGYQPRFHLLLRQDAAIALDGLRATLDSLRNQTYDAWRLTVLAEDADAGFAVRLWLAEHGAAHGERVAVVDGTQPAFDAKLIAAGSDATLYGVLCPGDLLGCDALAEIALAGGLHGQPEFLYADEARLSPASQEREPFFKPDFSPDLLLSTNYIGRPWFAAGSLLDRCDLTPRALFASGEYDLVLRCTEQARAIHHVPRLLAQRGPAMADDESSSRTALARAAQRRGFTAAVMDGCVPGTFRLRRTTPAKGKVSIIIPTCAAHGHIENCIRTLREKTAHQNYEIVCIDNIPAGESSWKAWLRQNADQVIDIPVAFNWSHFNNRAAAATDGEYLLFLNDDIEIVQEDWLDALLEHAQRPEVGVVGPQLLYPGGKVQHAGMFLGAGVGRHAFRFAPKDEPGYFGLALTQRNVIAVTGACMLMRRSFFVAMHGFEEAHSIVNNDVDFCLRAHQAGKLTVFTPHASLVHHELASRGKMGDTFDTTQFDSHWRTLFAAGDPYFSPRLSRHADDYRPDDEAVQTVFPGHPLFEHDEIRRILVVKLDHIGDFVTALPAIRRLKALFPQASLSVLAGQTARSVAALEPAIDEFIDFEFFHTRSQLGEKDLTKEDFEALLAQLAPYRFDLAIDLRKHLSTRDVLRYTGARFLAGYDYVGQFPFLDVALEWDGDKTLQRKRSHVTDDLLALVEAVNTATVHNRDLLAAPPEPIAMDALPAPVQTLFDRPVVAVHAGAGNITKQWPEAYFVDLIALLLERDGVNVLLVGGPDDRALSDSIMQRVLADGRVASVAGALPLAALPGLLARCGLYIGNDSGP
ncbi:MAG TPA: glycosyltransferase family 9 protein, partial [Rhodanobacter sp.]|nr:glycosyltransferase family 9 protein [Rhodanobacter sp.]